MKKCNKEMKKVYNKVDKVMEIVVEQRLILTMLSITGWWAMLWCSLFDLLIAYATIKSLRSFKCISAGPSD